MTDTPAAQAQAPGNAPPASAEDRRWDWEYSKWRHGRLDRVQASAQVWLGILTTLLGLLGSVVLFKGGALVTGATASGPFQATLVVLVGLVFAVTVIALIFGGQATWGGLADIPPSALPLHGEAAVPPQGEAAVLPESEAASRKRPSAWFVLAEKLALDRKEAPVKKPAWEVYRNRSLKSADTRRVYLHASRTAGVIAAALIAVLAIVAVIAGTLSPAPSYVIVVHHGRTNCVPASNNLKYSGVTQVIPVTVCVH